jgi:hypothetical protein
MKKILIFIQKNPIITKYILAIMTLFAMIISIRTYMNYITIEESIKNVNEETIQITQRKLYEKNFVIPYEESEYSEYFLWHENNILFPWEFMIRFEQEKEKEENIMDKEEEIKTPQESRKHFIKNINKKNE